MMLQYQMSHWGPFIKFFPIVNFVVEISLVGNFPKNLNGRNRFIVFPSTL